MSVGEICNREVVIVEQGTDAREASRLMREFHVGDLVVVERRGEENIPLGVVTDRDLVIEVLAREVDPATVTVMDLVAGELVSASEEESLLDCLQRMRQKGIRRLPVVNSGGGLVGILTMDDVLDLLSEELTDVVSLIARQSSSERQRRP
jgi:CBS domain-containing protein